MTSRVPLPSVTVAAFHKPLTMLHLASSPSAPRTKCRRKMNPEDLWMAVEDLGDVPLCRRCQGLPPRVMIEDPLPL